MMWFAIGYCFCWVLCTLRLIWEAREEKDVTAPMLFEFFFAGLFWPVLVTGALVGALVAYVETRWHGAWVILRKRKS